MSIQHVAAVLDCRRDDITGARRMVLVCLANRTNERGECWPSQKLIGQEAGLSVRSVQDHLKGLEQSGVIARETVARGQGRGGKTTYVLRLDQLAHAESAPANNAGANFAGANSGSLHTQKTAPHEPTEEPTIRGVERERAESSFEHFWEAYPKRVTEGGRAVKVGKPQAKAQWAKLRLNDQRAAYVGLRLYAEAAGSKPVDPERYLKRRLWEGLECEVAEVIPLKAATPPPADRRADAIRAAIRSSR